MSNSWVTQVRSSSPLRLKIHQDSSRFYRKSQMLSVLQPYGCANPRSSTTPTLSLRTFGLSSRTIRRISTSLFKEEAPKELPTWVQYKHSRTNTQMCQSRALLDRQQEESSQWHWLQAAHPRVLWGAAKKWLKFRRTRLWKALKM